MIAPDRRAAEWALRLGGAVEINGRIVKDIADLPKDQFVHVPYLQAVTDSSLENLGGLKALKWLNLGGMSVTDAGLIRNGTIARGAKSAENFRDPSSAAKN